MINVLYFASLRETLALDQEEVDYSQSVSTVSGLRAYLQQVHSEQWDGLPEGARLLVAVNQVMAEDDTKIQDGDEVAFFPPVTGG